MCSDWLEVSQPDRVGAMCFPARKPEMKCDDLGERRDNILLFAANIQNNTVLPKMYFLLPEVQNPHLNTVLYKLWKKNIDVVT